PKASLGSNSYRNLVSCCLDCNSLKADRDAVEFVRSLYRDRRLSAEELTGRLRALDDLAAGKLIPPLEPSTKGVKQASGVRLRPAEGSASSSYQPVAPC